MEKKERVITLHGYIFKSISLFWLNIRKFCFYYKTIFEVLFILIYAIEQLSLIWFTFNTKNPEELIIIVSIFAIIVLTTFSLHKLLMESKITVLEQKLISLWVEKVSLEEKTKYIITKYNELLKAYENLLSQDLNKSESHNNKKRQKNE